MFATRQLIWPLACVGMDAFASRQRVDDALMETVDRGGSLLPALSEHPDVEK